MLVVADSSPIILLLNISSVHNSSTNASNFSDSVDNPPDYPRTSQRFALFDSGISVI